jgi:hypothetical protein
VAAIHFERKGISLHARRGRVVNSGGKRIDKVPNRGDFSIIESLESKESNYLKILQELGEDPCIREW